ncbi:ATP-binding protein [Bosea sp. TWI1241]|uniref:ATP-binding protein n=1 Tax=Bosea sp. TWI1241 TaxID=3148904 RepID=UPI00320B6F4E
MKNSFVETENYLRFEGALKALDRRGADEARLVVVDGEPGLGKTTALMRWCAQNDAIYVRAKKEWTPAWFMKDLLAAFRIPAPHAFSKGFEIAMNTLMQRRAALSLARRSFLVVIDEADHISRSIDIMESIRDLADVADAPFVLVGMGRIRDNLTRYPQVASRVSQYVRFDKASDADVRALLDGLCEVPVADDLATFIRHATGGYTREIKEAIVNVERFGKRNQNGADNPVTIAAMAGQVLVNDRKTGQAITVPEPR